MPDETKPPQEKNKHLPPSPLELAKLALLIEQREAIERAAKVIAIPELARSPRQRRAPGFDTRDLMVKAMRYYAEADQIYGEFSGLSDENLLLVLRGPERAQSLLNHVLGPDWWSQGRKYALYDDEIKPNDPVYGKNFLNGLDPARNYLTGHARSFEWKQVNTVLDSVGGFLDECAMDECANEYGRTSVASAKRFRAQLEEVAFQMGLPVDTIIKWRFSNDVRLGVTGEELGVYYLETIAIRDGPAGLSGQLRVHIGWSFSQGFLDEVIKWRHRLKKRPKRRSD